MIYDYVKEVCSNCAYYEERIYKSGFYHEFGYEPYNDIEHLCKYVYSLTPQSLCYKPRENCPIIVGFISANLQKSQEIYGDKIFQCGSSCGDCIVCEKLEAHFPEKNEPEFYCDETECIKRSV